MRKSTGLLVVAAVFAVLMIANIVLMDKPASAAPPVASEVASVAAQGVAQSQDPNILWGSRDRITFRCESSDGRMRRCPADLRGRVDVRLARQISDASCREGSTWGWDRNGVWVDRGCRGEFEVFRRSGWDDDTYIRCESNDGRRNYCPIDLGGRADVDMSRQLSNSPCREGSTWGWDRSGVWVDRGCRAEFKVDRRSGGWDDNYIRCESNDGRRQYCPLGNWGGGRGQVRLARQLSISPCREGSTWGADNRGIWVDRGCRGEFEVDRRGGGGGGGGGGGDTDRIVRCESNGGRRSCPIGDRVRGVTLSRQLSNAVCREGATWGWNGREIWVDRGCRAEFAIDRDRGRR